MRQVRQILLQRGCLPACFEIKDDTVVELLKLPDGDLERAAKDRKEKNNGKNKSPNGPKTGPKTNNLEMIVAATAGCELVDVVGARP